MFQTFDHAKIYLPLSNPDESAWAYAELMVNAPWFFADCEITEGDMSIRSSYILSNPTQLNELSVNPHAEILALYVVSPPHMNWTNSWKMDQVVRVSKGLTNEDNYQTEVDIYELTNGGKYYSTGLNVNESNIENIKVIFSV